MSAPQTARHLSPQLAEIGRQFLDNTERAKRLTAGMSDAGLIQRQSSSGWSVAECIAHLTLTTREYLSLADSAFKDAPRAPGPYRADWMGRLLCWSQEPPYKHMKSKTLPAFVPGAIEDPLSVVPSFIESQKLLLARLDEAEGIALDRVKVVSSFNKKIKYNLLSFFQLLAAHQRRHLWQAEQVKSQL
ncbi:MAG TPA: DinB family protein [Terriglobales bacterium]|nr:DinB family protein [Terriglobales bacterium]